MLDAAAKEKPWPFRVNRIGSYLLIDIEGPCGDLDIKEGVPAERKFPEIGRRSKSLANQVPRALSSEAAFALLGQGLNAVWEKKGKRTSVPATKVLNHVLEIMPDFKVRNTPFKKFARMLDSAAKEKPWPFRVERNGSDPLIDIQELEATY
ncbi:unnamed protein product [Prorocentrum cordatum]|uniref:Uncharacterized protein n=1 Tax=Prorocentrum cordatum TaxID=2364126 RepID=A0ABN9Y0F7_9DINO|nr:unnamed protein product [Polarella glacialis]